MAVVSLTSKRMPAMRFQVCHIRTPHPMSVFAAEQDRKAPGASAEHAVRTVAP
jgi:hypothetical protein